MEVVNGITTIVLTLVTVWYALSTHRALVLMARQAKSMEDQSKVIARQTELIGLGSIVTAYAGLHAGSGPHHTDLEALAKKLWKKLEESS